MEVIVLLLFASLMISGGFLIAFIWNVMHGQFDDIESPAKKILFDDIPIHNNKK